LQQALVSLPRVCCTPFASAAPRQQHLTPAHQATYAERTAASSPLGAREHLKINDIRFPRHLSARMQLDEFRYLICYALVGA
jgi:hypothetical protein